MTESDIDSWMRIPFDARCGKNGPPQWLSFGDADMPLDQQADDDFSLTFTSDPFPVESSILGFPRLVTKMAVNNHNGGVVIARLCDVFPDGRVNLITYGVLNLTHYKGHGKADVQPLIPGEIFDVNVELHSIGYKIPAGHCIRLSLSTNWWPQIWPSSKAVEAKLLLGKSTKLCIPVYSGSENRTELVRQVIV